MFAKRLRRDMSGNFTANFRPLYVPSGGVIFIFL